MNYPKLMPQLLISAQNAGLRILEDFRSEVEVMRKADNSPKTKTDDAAENIILADLERLSPFAVVAEERFSNSHLPKAGAHDQFWLVDALDGTRQFIAGLNDFSVNIALIDKGRPVMGVIHAPVTNESWYAYKDGGAFHAKDGVVRQISMREPRPSALSVLGGRTSAAPETLEPFIGSHQVEKRGVRSSSLKFCLLAVGEWDVYPRLGNTYEWDTAAGDIILSEAGGVILDIRTGKTLAYNKQNPDYLNSGFVAGHAALFKGPFAKLS